MLAIHAPPPAAPPYAKIVLLRARRRRAGARYSTKDVNKMAETIMKGKPVIDKLNEHLKSRAEALRARGAAPALAIVRVGDNGDDMAYERNAAKCCEAAGVRCGSYTCGRCAAGGASRLRP